MNNVDITPPPSERKTNRRHLCGNRMGTRWRGKLPIPPKAHPLVRRLIQELNNQQSTIGELAERAGMRRATISGWRYNHQPRIDDLEAALNTLDLELTVRVKGTGRPKK